MYYLLSMDKMFLMGMQQQLQNYCVSYFQDFEWLVAVRFQHSTFTAWVVSSKRVHVALFLKMITS